MKQIVNASLMFFCFSIVAFILLYLIVSCFSLSFNMMAWDYDSKLIFCGGGITIEIIIMTFMIENLLR
jgi:hypothetical protein